jgi:cytochrome c oxidase assembly protein subunit 15
MCSRTWNDLTAHPASLPFEENLSSNGAKARSAFRWTLLATAAIYVQIVLGAVMRHTGAGLAIPDFPAAFGGLWPSADELQHRGVGLHLAHRVGAVVVLVLVLAAVRALGRLSAVNPVFAGFAAAWTGLVTIQILLGALSIWSKKAPPLTAAHLAGGALCWVTGVLATVCVGACRNRANAISSRIRA